MDFVLGNRINFRTVSRCAVGFTDLLLSNTRWWPQSPLPLPPSAVATMTMVISAIDLALGCSIFMGDHYGRGVIGLWTVMHLSHIVAVIYAPIMVQDASQLPEHFLPLDYDGYHGLEKPNFDETEQSSLLRFSLSTTSLWFLTRFLVLSIVAANSKLQSRPKRRIGR